MARKVNKTIKAHDGGLRDGPGSSESSLKHAGPRRKRKIFLQYRVFVSKSANRSLSKVSPAFNTFRLVQSPARTMEGSNVMNTGSKRHFRSSRLTKYFHNKSLLFLRFSLSFLSSSSLICLSLFPSCLLSVSFLCLSLQLFFSCLSYFKSLHVTQLASSIYNINIQSLSCNIH